VRALEPGDLRAAAAVSAQAFELDISDRGDEGRWRGRLAYLLDTDPDGGFVAELDGHVIGVAQAMLRERLWCLSLLTVQPSVQSAGAGRALLERALEYGREADAGVIVSSNDPRALRLYGLSGFSLLPTFQAEGSLRRASLPRPDPGLRDVGRADLEALEEISREVRGAPHTAELEFALVRGARIVRIAERGFAVTMPDHGVWLLVARDDVTASALLWSALELVGEAESTAVRWITGEQEWAIDLLLRAGLQLSAYGALCVRGRLGPLHPFLPSGPFA
jgi:GNAT superfamily N-acetyltransferase